MIAFIRCMRVLITGSVVGTALMLASGCAEVRYDSLDGVPDTKEPVVKLVQYAHDVHFANSEPRPSSIENERLETFLKAVEVGYGDRIYVVAGSVARENTIAARLSDQRRSAVVDVIARHGIKPVAIQGDLGHEAAPAGTVKVVVRRHVVTLPGCPDWTGGPGTYTNTPSRNWGCATATNLGRMVADPRDLAVGRDPGDADGEYMATSIERYRKGKTKELINVNAGAFVLDQSQQQDSSGNSN